MCVCSGKLHARHKPKNTFFPSFFRRACLLFIDDHCQVSEVMLHKSVFLLYPLSRSSGSFGLDMGTPREETPRYPTHAGLIMDIRHVGNRRFCRCLRFGGSGLKMKKFSWCFSSNSVLSVSVSEQSGLLKEIAFDCVDCVIFNGNTCIDFMNLLLTLVLLGIIIISVFSLHTHTRCPNRLFILILIKFVIQVILINCSNLHVICNVP